MLFHHVGVHVSDLAKSRPMYDAIFETLGYENYDVPGYVAAAWGTPTCSFRVVQPPLDSISASTSHICFGAPSEEAVKAFYEAGQKFGGKGVAAPEAYVEFGHRHLTAMLCDLDGNHVEAVYVDPAIVE
jgi:predicted lactoylglutathione lyase